MNLIYGTGVMHNSLAMFWPVANSIFCYIFMVELLPKWSFKSFTCLDRVKVVNLFSVVRSWWLLFDAWNVWKHGLLFCTRLIIFSVFNNNYLAYDFKLLWILLGFNCYTEIFIETRKIKQEKIDNKSFTRKPGSTYQLDFIMNHP